LWAAVAALFRSISPGGAPSVPRPICSVSGDLVHMSLLHARPDHCPRTGRLAAAAATCRVVGIVGIVGIVGVVGTKRSAQA
jgi:hypothetical protein